jgi:hypothetical protein
LPTAVARTTPTVDSASVTDRIVFLPVISDDRVATETAYPQIAALSDRDLQVNDIDMRYSKTLRQVAIDPATKRQHA